MKFEVTSVLNQLKKGIILFDIGIFFLPSSLFIGGIFLILASIFGFIYKRPSLFKDRFNSSFFICGILILISTIVQYFIFQNDYKELISNNLTITKEIENYSWDPTLSIYGLGNWIPQIYLFLSCQEFLNSPQKRKRFSIILIISNFPVLWSGFSQYYFGWYGPFETLNGLIVWFQRPILRDYGLTGLFNNANYAGSWLNLVWPFCIALVLERSQKLLKKSFSISILLATGLALFLTNSRNAWAGLIGAIPIVCGIENILVISILLVILIGILLYSFLPIFNSELQNIIRGLLPSNFIYKLSLINNSSYQISRIGIYLKAINLLKLDPIFGIGAAAFSSIYAFSSIDWIAHPHNLPIELALSYGIPVSILLFGTIYFLLILTGKFLFISNIRQLKNNDYFDRALWASTFFFMFSQLTDIQYFDGKLSLIFWLFLAGLKNIFHEYKNNKI